MAWYWQIWLLVAFAIIAVVWKLVWLNIRDRTEYIYLQLIDSASGKPLQGLAVYASIAYFPELNHWDFGKDMNQLMDEYALNKIGVTDSDGCLRFRNRWLTIHQLIIPVCHKVFRYKDELFEFRSFSKTPKVLKV